MVPAAAARLLFTLLLAGLPLLASLPAVQAQDAGPDDELEPEAPGGPQLRWEDAPESLEAQGSGRVPLTLVLRVDATGCAEGTQVPVVVGADGTDGLQAALDRARHVFQVPPGAVHEARTTLQLAVGGAGAGAVTLRAHPEVAPGSCLGQVGGAATHVARVGSWSPPAGTGAEGGTRPITLRGEDPLPKVLLVAAAGLLALRVLRARPSRGS